MEEDNASRLVNELYEQSKLMSKEGKNGRSDNGLKEQFNVCKLLKYSIPSKLYMFKPETSKDAIFTISEFVVSILLPVIAPGARESMA
jgi:hypothetical protein